LRTKQEENVVFDKKSLDKVGVIFSLATALVVLFAAAILRSHLDQPSAIDSRPAVFASIPANGQ
jgi:hypothetical protein